MTAKFDMQRNPAYAIDYEVQCKGRRFSGSKRRIVWQFGFADRSAIEAGKTGSECRGAEHIVVFVWSMSSNKQRVLVDGTEVTFERKSCDRYECEWTMAGGHELKVVAHQTAPLFNKEPDFRQYDLVIDGLSYFEMPKMYQLGGVAQSSSPPRPAIVSRSTSVPTPMPSSPDSIASSEPSSDFFSASEPEPSCSRPAYRKTYSVPDLLDYPLPSMTQQISRPMHLQTSSFLPQLPANDTVFYFASSAAAITPAYHYQSKPNVTPTITPDSSVHSRTSSYMHEDSDAELDRALRMLVDLE